jgi:hypothetical protein
MPRWAPVRRDYRTNHKRLQILDYVLFTFKLLSNDSRYSVYRMFSSQQSTLFRRTEDRVAPKSSSRINIICIYIKVKPMSEILVINGRTKVGWQLPTCMHFLVDFPVYDLCHPRPTCSFIPTSIRHNFQLFLRLLQPLFPLS